MKHLLLALCLSLFAACSAETSEAPADKASAAPDGAKLFGNQLCKTCHGPEGQGMPSMGPSLLNMEQHWTRESLAAYLADPAGVKKATPRLADDTTKYRMPMPKSGLSEAGRLALADYVLALE